MTFIVVLIALLVERFFNWAHLRQWGWFVSYQHAISKRLSVKSPYLQLAILIIPLLIITLLISLLLDDWLYGLLSFLFQLIILIYCLGPRNLWAESFAQPTTPLPDEAHLPASSFLSRFFVAANHRLFAVIFWYLVLGPLGAVLYRAVALAADTAQLEMSTHLSPSAKWLNALLDWIPVRIFTFLFTLGGHFVCALAVWRKQALLGLSSNDAMLIDCGLAAIGNDTHIAVEKSAVSLIDRVFVIVLILIAIGTLII